MYPQHHPHCGCGCKRATQPIAQPYPMPNQPIAQPYPNQPVSQQPYPTQTSPFAQQPVILPPLCRYTDSYTKREVPFIQPLININRQHTIDVPKTYYETINQNVAVSPATDNPFMGRNRYPRC